MLFNMADYEGWGVIGTNQSPMTSNKWEDCRTTANATRDAFFKSVNEYLAYSVANRLSCESNCDAALNLLLDEKSANMLTVISTGNIFWDGLINSTFTKEKHDNYSAALEAYMYTLRKLLSILDGDTTDPI